MIRVSTLQALVTDGLWRKSLSAIRSLGKAGYQVSVMGDSVFTTGFWSRYTYRRFTAPTAAQDPEGFGQALIATLSKLQRPVLLPMEDPTLMWVSKHRGQLSALADFLLPSEEALEIAQDKGRTFRLAESLGLLAPKTWEPKAPDEFAELVAARPIGLFVVKPRHGTGSSGVVYGEKRSKEEWLAHWKTYGPMLVQERIPSHGHAQGVSLLMDAKGECVAAFAHERITQYPISGGPSTDRRSIHAPELVSQSIALLKALKWKGVAMVEWKLDPMDGNRPKLLEINPRFWGSLELAVRSGVDFPVLYARAARGEKLPIVGTAALTYPDGVRCRWMVPGEVLRYVSSPRGERESWLEFSEGALKYAEEWDKRDIRGFLATVVCTAALALNPKFWKYVRR
jgi:predicted ATP-grasp superfamily ATP-dependent carboligase